MIKSRIECTGCFACKQTCPVNAIDMGLDKNGFMVPVVNNKCISCNLCNKVCPIDKPLNRRNQKVFSFINSKEDILIRASSGGMFAAIAEYIIEQKGVVFGCILNKNKSAIQAYTTSKDGIKMMQGSKYVQSYVGNTFVEVKRFLSQGKKVLYSGTPCQIDGLYNYLGKDYDDLITIDIVCHGVPNQGMLDNELKWIEKREQSKIKRILFRDKRINGWCLIGSLQIGNRKKLFFPANSPYYYYFDKGSIYRDCCYTCKYANLNRIGDITIGDFWGIERSSNLKASTIGKGVSLVISNSNKGLNTIKKVAIKGKLTPNKIESAIIENIQLIRPVSNNNRDIEIIEMYHQNNFKGIMNKYRKETGASRLVKTLKVFFPVNIKLKLKGLNKNAK